MLDTVACKYKWPHIISSLTLTYPPGSCAEVFTYAIAAFCFHRYKRTLISLLCVIQKKKHFSGSGTVGGVLQTSVFNIRPVCRITKEKIPCSVSEISTLIEVTKISKHEGNCSVIVQYFVPGSWHWTCSRVSHRVSTSPNEQYKPESSSVTSATLPSTWPPETKIGISSL